MSMKMNTKKSKKGNNDNDNVSSSNNNYKKKGKNVVNIGIEDIVDVGEMGMENEFTDAPPVEDVRVKVGKKRKQPDTDTEFVSLKKSKKRIKEEPVLEEFSTNSDVNNIDNTVFNTSAAMSSCSIPKKSKKKKIKTLPANATHSFVITDQNGGSINILELPVQQNGKSITEIKQEVDLNTSFDIPTSPQYKIEVDNSVLDNIDGMDMAPEDKVVHITIKDVEDTDSSEINENDFLAVNKIQALKGTTQGIIDWPKEDLKKLVDRMEASIPENDGLAFNTRVEKLQWDTIAFKQYTVEECKNMWLLVQKQIRRFRLLKEVLADAKEWINSPKPKCKKAPRHPDMPRKPLSAYFLYYMKKRDIYHKSNPGLDATEISKILAQEFKNISPEKRLKYEKLALKKRKEYEEKLEEFYQTHPEIPRAGRHPKVNKEKTPRPPKPPKPPRPPKPVKEKPAPKPPKERIPKRPPPPFQFFYLSELEREGDAVQDKLAFKEVCKERWKELHDRKKLVWINYAEIEYAKFEEAMQQYIKNHPDYNHHHPHKSILTKEDIQTKERAAGKPSKPPGSAYNLFARMLLQSDEIKAIHVKDRLVYVSNKWKNCGEDEKKQFRDLSLQMNEKYKLEFASYLKTLPESERKKELQKNLPKRRKSQDVERVETNKKKRSERKTANKKLVEPEQPPISAFKYFATLYTGEDPVAQAWKALTAEQKKIYEDELVRKKQAYIVDFEKFLKSLTKEELEEFSNSRRRIKKEEDDDEEEEGGSSEESGTEDSDSDEEDEEEEEEK